MRDFDFWEAWVVHTLLVAAAGVLLFGLGLFGHVLWLTGFFWETLGFLVFSALIGLVLTLRFT
jgi:hypothetical protein